jgi:hypothetical protein
MAVGVSTFRRNTVQSERTRLCLIISKMEIFRYAYYSIFYVMVCDKDNRRNHRCCNEFATLGHVSVTCKIELVVRSMKLTGKLWCRV